jgi:hypothetical protein
MSNVTNTTTSHKPPLKYVNLKKLYKDESYCINELVQAREIFCKKSTTRSKYELMQKALCMVFLYAPNKRIQELAKATLEESTTRKWYYETRAWNQQGSCVI